MAKRPFHGDALRQARRAKHLTQRELAALIGCSRNIVNRAEVESKCSDRMASRMARELGTPLEDLYRKFADEQADTLNDRERRVLEIMRMGPEAASAVWHFALGVEASARKA